MRRAHPAICGALFFFSVLTLHAQYGEVLDQAAEQATLTAGAAIRLLGTAAGSLAPETGEEEARAALAGLGVLPPRAAAGEPITYGDLAFLLAQLFDLRGGFGYGLFPGPRAAFRELQARGLIPAGERAGHTVSGPDAVALLRRFLESRGQPQ